MEVPSTSTEPLSHPTVIPILVFITSGMPTVQVETDEEFSSPLDLTTMDSVIRKILHLVSRMIDKTNSLSLVMVTCFARMTLRFPMMQPQTTLSTGCGSGHSSPRMGNNLASKLTLNASILR